MQNTLFYQILNKAKEIPSEEELPSQLLDYLQSNVSIWRRLTTTA
jgi:hypothetical protein